MSELLVPAALSSGLNVALALAAYWWARGTSRAAHFIFPISLALVLIASFALGAFESRVVFEAGSGVACFIAAVVITVPGVLLGIKTALQRRAQLVGVIFSASVAAVLGAGFPVAALALITVLTRNAL